MHAGAYWGHYRDTVKADACFCKAQVYELELQNFLEKAANR